MAGKIDLNRGVKQRKHNKTGMWVSMYKDDPGVYYDAHGNRVNELIARDAGFDVNALALEHRRKVLTGEAQNRIARELELAEKNSKPKVLREGGGYQVLDMRLDRAVVTDMEGNKLTAEPIPADIAIDLWAKLTAENPEVTSGGEKPAEPKQVGKVKALA